MIIILKYSNLYFLFLKLLKILFNQHKEFTEKNKNPHQNQKNIIKSYGKNSDLHFENIYEENHIYFKSRVLGNNCDDGCVCKGNKCTGCNSHYYKKIDRNEIECDQCDRECLECSAGGSDDCTSCYNGSVLSNNKCVQCDSTKGKFISGGECKNCDSNCKTCMQKNTTCTSCNGGQLLNLQQQCMTCDVSQGYYKSGSQCLKCHNTCAQCTGGKETECTVCPNGSNLQSGKCLACDTTNGYYISSTAQCLKCDSSCKTCENNTKNSCLSCMQPNYLKNDKTCSACDINNGYFIDVTNNSCTPCNNCKTCKSANVCTTCNSPNYLRVFDGTCNSCTDLGTFKNENLKQCIKCHSSCATCTDETAQGCITCTGSLKLFQDKSCKTCDISDGYFIYNNTECKTCDSRCKTCISEGADKCDSCRSPNLRQNPIPGGNAGGFACGPCDTNLGYYQSQNDCYKCDPSCKTCNGSLATDCLTCNVGQVFQEQNGTKLCITCDTQNNFYVENTGNVQYCKQCDISCQRCSNGLPNGCLTCQQNSYLLKPNNTCGPCGAQHFQSQTFCYKCDVYCETCNGTQSDNCLSCINNFYLTKQNKCVNQCPPDTFLSGQKCESCHPSCQTCSEASKCLTCSNGLNLYDNICQVCPKNYYGENGVCRQCHTSCLSCSGSSQNECTACYGDIQLISQSCTNPCQQDQVYKGNTCSNCHESCATCSDINAESCIICKNNFTFKKNEQSNTKTCVDCSIEQQYFQQGSDCLACDPSCLTCNAEKNNQKCLTCPSNFYLQVETNSCVACTQDYYYQYGAECHKTPPNCKKGIYNNNKFQCNECDDTIPTGGTVKYVRNQNLDQCIECPDLLHFISTDQICKKCHQSCQKCSGETQNECLKCFDGMHILLGQNNEKQCVECGEGYNLNNDGSNTCYACIRNCKQCNNQSKCIVCQNGWFLDDNDQCVDTCETQNGKFILNEGNKCLSCGANCMNCTNKTNCAICQNGYSKQLQQNNIDVSCVICDINNKYFIDQGDNFCKQCDLSCKTCSGPNDEQCSSCESSKYLYPDNTCKVCTGNNYQENGLCKPCDNKCDGCNSNNCIKCASGFYFKEGTQQCEHCDIQNKNFIQNNLTCSKCHEKCQTCSGPLEKNCILCSGKYTKDIHGNCVECDQSNGFFEDNLNKLCLPCASNCQQCTGANIQQCKKCESGLYIKEIDSSNVDCLECMEKDGYFIDGIKCTKCNPGCKTCYGGAANQCLSCPVGTFILGADHTCQECPNGDYAQLNKVQKFSECQEYDIVCLKDIFTSKYTLSIKCNKCKNGYILQYEPNICISECKEIGTGLQYNQMTKQCECSDQSNYFHIPSSITKQMTFCVQNIADGYFCNQDKICTPCNSKCKVCQSHTTCKVCLDTYYVWFGECYDSCADQKGLVEINANEKQNGNICRCKQGYIIRVQDKICVKILKIESIKLSIKDDNNLITVILNRIPYNDETEDLKMIIDPLQLNLNKDYQILYQKIIEEKIYFLIKVDQNRKINEVELTFNKEVHKVTLKNTILTTEEYNQNNQSSLERSENVNNISNSFIPENEQARNIMLVLKNFQILCILSNFIQVLGPIVMLKESIPPQVFTYSILGASFIFEKIPSYEELSFEISTSENTNHKNKQQSEEENYTHKFRLLHSLGLQKTLYSNFVFPHLSIVVVTIIVFLNLFARAIMKGKQYTLNIVNFLLNLMSNLNQGYITPTIFSIYFSISFQETKGLAIFQCTIHVFFMILMGYVLIKKDTKYIEENIPNFLENIDFRAKGSKSYIIISYIKKYFIISIFLSTSSNGLISSTIISITFFLQGFYIWYYRFFQFRIISYFKVFQEFFIGSTFIVLALACKKLNQVLENSIISNSDLYELENKSLIVFYMLIICLFLSLILFFIRLIISSIEVFKKIKLMIQKKRQKLKEKNQNNTYWQELINDSFNTFHSTSARQRLTTFKLLHPKTVNLKQNDSPKLTQGNNSLEIQ